MDIGIIGSGNMAGRLIPALQQAGLHVAAIYGRNRESTTTLAEKYNLVVCNHMGELNTEIIFLCVTDDAIEEVASGLQNYPGLVIHTSGSVSSIVLQHFAHYGVLWPVQTLTRQGRLSFEKIPLCITASDAETLDIISSIASMLSTRVYPLTDEQRRKIHLCAVMTNNFINHLVVVTRDFMQNNQLNYEIIVPLIRTTLEKVTTQPYNFQQTGPAIRGDEGVIRGHMQILENDPQLKDLYKTITESIQSYAHH